jgi:hypothetical protein
MFQTGGAQLLHQAQLGERQPDLASRAPSHPRPCLVMGEICGSEGGGKGHLAHNMPSSIMALSISVLERCTYAHQVGSTRRTWSWTVAPKTTVPRSPYGVVIASPGRAGSASGSLPTLWGCELGASQGSSGPPWSSGASSGVRLVRQAHDPQYAARTSARRKHH